MLTLKIMSKLGIIPVIMMAGAGLASAQWTQVGGAPNASTCLLLTDGSVMCQNGEQNKSWNRLTPDSNGHYATGAWTALQDLPQPNPSGYAPLYYASAVMPDGRVFVIGGEYNNGYTACTSPPAKNCPTTLGYIFDPTANGGAGQWSGPITVPNNYTGSDNQGIILSDGTILVADINTGNIFQLNPATATLTQVNATGKLDANDEEGWTLLPNGHVLTVDANNTNINGGTPFEIYDPTTNPPAWASPGNPGFTPVNLADINGAGTGTKEVGPAVLRPDGTIIYFGGNPTGQNAIYNTTNGTWQQAVTFPVNGSNVQLNVADGPAAILPDGNALVEAGPQFNVAGGQLFEFDTNANSTVGQIGELTDVTAGGPGISGQASFNGRMLVLPTGEVLFTHGNNDVWLYTHTGNPQDAWRPVITAGPSSVDPGNTYTISGTQFNGLSQGGAYGDNAQMATNYPLVRIVNKGNVLYARTHNHSSMGVATGSTVVSTSFDAPAGLDTTVTSQLFVVANGIPSLPFIINGPGLSIPGPLSFNTCNGTSTTTTLNICNTGKQDLSINNITSSDPQISVTPPSSGYSLTISPDACFPFQVQYTPSKTGTTNATLTVTSNDPNTPSAQVKVTATAPAPSINATLVSNGNFGSICPGGLSQLNLQVTNQSSCNLVISNISSSNANFLPPTTSLPLTLTADATVSLPVTFQPSGTVCSSTADTRTGTITITSNDPVNGTLIENVKGSVPCPQVNATVANTGSFGNVCAGNQADLNLQVLNQGQCNLTISSIALSDPADFVLPTVGLPLVLSADANANLPIRFKPTGGVCSNTTARTSTVTIVSNDPTHPLFNPVASVSGIEGCPQLVLSPQNLTGLFAFPATVSDPTGNLGCYTDRQISISNSGTCPLNITSLSAGPANTFNVINPTVPLSIGPGAGPVPVTVRFRPTNLTGQNPSAPDQQTGTLTIVSNDPVATDNTANLCGEPAFHSGVRLLVVDGTGAPISSVKSVSLASKGLHPGISETLAPAVAMTAPNICGNSITYHLDNETLPPAGTTGNSPRASYGLSVKQGATSAFMSFTLGQCQMLQTVMQIK